MSNDYVPPAGTAQVALIPGLTPSDGGDKLFSPRNLIAFAIIALFGFEVLAPFFYAVPTGPAWNQILTTGKTVENVLMLVLGYFFGTTITSQKKDDTIRQQALAQPPFAQPPFDLSTVAQVAPPAAPEVKDPAYDDPDAGRGAEPAPDPAAAAGVQAGDGRPAE